ncbi:MAG: UDP-N-acetylglucosamine 2-epimerase (non-hydrolyzing) [Acidobacteria bacterium]|nr:UDP-N-acetylglucosamine 2-epimerase (non-hydrolyzing) [Acidobacteriota bacterium]
MLILNVVGARPNFMKIGPLVKEMRHRDLPQVLVHTGQHYDENLSRQFFDQLGIPKPDINLQVGSASQAVQTAEIMRCFEPVVVECHPDLVLVVGDVNSTMACALVAAKFCIPVAHVEAGLRSFDRTMPEEINRIVTDAVSDLLFVSEPSGIQNLKREGVPDHKIHFVGNVMIDSLLEHRKAAEESKILERLNLAATNRYALVTLHRPSNVDEPEKLRGLLEALAELTQDLPVIFPMHPRTRNKAIEASLQLELDRLIVTEPLGYLDFLHLMSAAAVVITDSGGVQEETTVLGVPCLTVRENTERPATVEQGTNRLVGSDPAHLLRSVRTVLQGDRSPSRLPELWDGKAAQRIVEVLLRQDWRKH